MADGDVSLLLTRLTRYSEALDRHTATIQQAYDRAQESLANLRRVYAGAAADDFFSHWNRTTEALERYLEGARGIKEILDARISTLREADRPLDEEGSTNYSRVPAGGAAGIEGSGVEPLGVTPPDSQEGERTGRIEVSPNVAWKPSEHALGLNGLPEFDNKDTYGRMMIGGEEYFLKSGTGQPGIEARNNPNIKAGAVTPGHVEGHAAMILRRAEVSEATLFINHPKGPCRYCERATVNIIPAGSRLTVIWPHGRYTYRGRG